jgi:hypothetical protein
VEDGTDETTGAVQHFRAGFHVIDVEFAKFGSCLRESISDFAIHPIPTLTDTPPSQSDVVNVLVPNAALYTFLPTPEKHPFPVNLI